jgi:CDP-glucose 4,6-dehydratase
MFNSFYKGKKVLVTGHTGFKGGWLSLWLRMLDAKVTGLSLPAPTQPSLHELLAGRIFEEEINCDIRHYADLKAAVARVRPDIVFHLAAQPIVRRSYVDPIETFQTNALGTAHLLDAVRVAALPAPVLIITSDKCYENREWDFAYRENDPLGGHDVYSASKAATELVAHAWSRSFFKPSASLGPVATARAGNVIGGGDYAHDRIVPDCVRALVDGKPILVRNPKAARPWQHVLECLSGYLWLGARLAREGKESPLAAAFNFGPDPSSRESVRTLVESILESWPGTWEDVSDPTQPHEAALLALAIDRAGALLDWRPVWGFEEAVQQTVGWYRRRHMLRESDMLEFSESQIMAYAEAAGKRELPWSR